jgi:hypothetical protein
VLSLTTPTADATAVAGRVRLSLAAERERARQRRERSQPGVPGDHLQRLLAVRRSRVHPVVICTAPWHLDCAGHVPMSREAWRWRLRTV